MYAQFVRSITNLTTVDLGEVENKLSIYNATISHPEQIFDRFYEDIECENQYCAMTVEIGFDGINLDVWSIPLSVWFFGNCIVVAVVAVVVVMVVLVLVVIRDNMT